VRLGVQRGSTPLSTGLVQLCGTAFEGHPYARPVVGLEEDLDRITADDCRTYHAARYAPNNAVVTVVGRFDPAEALEAARRTFETVPKRKVPAAPPAALRTANASRTVAEPYPFQTPAVVVGWRLPAAKGADLAALELTSRILSSRPSSRLQKVLAVRGGPNALVRGELDLRAEAGLLAVAAVLPAGADTAAMRAVEKTLLDEVERFTTEGAGAEELEAARHAALLGSSLGRESARGQALVLGAAHVIGGDARLDAKRLERLAVATAADVRKVAARHLVPASRTIVWLLPAGESGAER
jgi:zinc protease